MLNKHFVLPGQVLATSNAETDGGFLRGHGTYIEIVPENESDDEDDYDVDGNFSGGMAGIAKKKRDTSSWGNDNNSNVVMQQDDDKDDKDEGNNNEHEQPTNKGNQRIGSWYS